MFFVSVASKGVRVYISSLFSTLTRDPVSVYSNGSSLTPGAETSLLWQASPASSRSLPRRTMTHLWHPRTGTTVFLPRLAAATELLVIDLLAQHDPQPDPELASCGDSRFTPSLLCQLAPVEALQLWISAYGVYGCLAPEKPQEWVTLLAQPAGPLLTAAGVFARNHPHVAHHCFAICEPRWVTQKHIGGQCRDRSHSRVAHQQFGPRTLQGLVAHALIQFLDLRPTFDTSPAARCADRRYAAATATI